jgi:SAM-dependent methyltransferase
MHPSSLENMRKVRSIYLTELNPNIKILDVGGRGIDKDRSYRSVYEDLNPEYRIADIEDGVGVTDIMPGPYTLPFDNNEFDLIVSGQMLEHCANPFKSIAEMKRVLKHRGYIVIIAPSAGPRHDIIDCWRFMDDAFKAITDDIGGINVIADWIQRDAPDERSRKWQDHIFVGRKI